MSGHFGCKFFFWWLPLSANAVSIYRLTGSRELNEVSLVGAFSVILKTSPKVRWQLYWKPWRIVLQSWKFSPQADWNLCRLFLISETASKVHLKLDSCCLLMKIYKFSRGGALLRLLLSTATISFHSILDAFMAYYTRV